MDLSFRDWSRLPAHIVELMVTKIDRFSDYVRFSGVCPGWRYVALDANVEHKGKLDALNASRNKLPMLMFKIDNETKDEWSLYDVSNEKTYTVKLPIPYNYRFVGSSLGWLFCVQENMVVTLVNPFNNCCISLPVFKDPRKFFRRWHRIYLEYYIRKGILLSDPHVSPDGFAVVVLYAHEGRLSFFKSGELSWTFIHSELLLSDIIYYKGNLYGVSRYGQFVQIDIDRRTIKTIIRATDNVIINYIYLVESQDGDLFMVHRIWGCGSFLSLYPNEADVDDNDTNDLRYQIYENVSSDSEVELEPPSFYYYENPGKTHKFKVFKMTHPVEGESSPTWVNINNIGDQALFVGDNHSVSVLATDFSGCMPNSIHFTPHHHNYNFPYIYYGLEEDCSIFNVLEGEFYDQLLIGKFKYPPIWFVPTLQGIN